MQPLKDAFDPLDHQGKRAVQLVLCRYALRVWETYVQRYGRLSMWTRPSGVTINGDLDALETQSGDAPGPFAFARGLPFELHTKFGEELNCGHDISLASNAWQHSPPRASDWT